MLERKDGSLVAYMRENGPLNKIRACESTDGGLTWGKVGTIDLPNPGSGLDAVRLANGFIGLWLPGAWEIPASDNWAAIRLEGGGRSHIVFYIHSDDADAALANLQAHAVRYYGPRVNEKGEVHIDFEDPDGHMLEYWARTSFGPLPDRDA